MERETEDSDKLLKLSVIHKSVDTPDSERAFTIFFNIVISHFLILR